MINGSAHSHFPLPVLECRKFLKMEILMPEIQQGKSLFLLVRASRKGAPLSITDETATDPVGSRFPARDHLHFSKIC